MNRKINTLLLMLISAAVMAGAVYLYGVLSERYRTETDEKISEDSFLSSQEVRAEKEIIYAEDFTVYDSEGNKVSLSDLRGKPVVVNFWTSWCVYCVKELPGFENLYSEYGDSVNFIMVDLCDGYRETKEKAEQFKEENGFTFPLYFDTDFDASEAYSVSSIPVTLVINSEGELYKTHTGYMDEKTLREYIEYVTAG